MVVSGDTDALRLRLRLDYAAPGLMSVQDVVIKSGPQAWKTAALLTFGNKDSGEVSHRTLRVQTWTRAAGEGFDFKHKADLRWSCDDGEIITLSALLTTSMPAAGTYTLVEDGSPAAAVAKLVAGDAADAADAVAELLTLPAVRAALAASGAAVAGAALITAQRQRAALARLEALALDPNTTEGGLQNALTGEWWLFGGRFLGEHRRRQFTSLDQLDIPLLRADGSLHIVELKRAHIPKLLVEHRSHFVPGIDVHLAVGQTMNYLRALDEEWLQIRHNFGVDVRRATATVVVGHPEHCLHSEEEVAQTLRTYNSHLARVEVITYAELIAGATAALAATESDPGPASARSTSQAAASRVYAIAPDPVGEPWADSNLWNDDADPWSSATATWDDEPPF